MRVRGAQEREGERERCVWWYVSWLLISSHLPLSSVKKIDLPTVSESPEGFMKSIFFFSLLVEATRGVLTMVEKDDEDSTRSRATNSDSILDSRDET